MNRLISLAILSLLAFGGCDNQQSSNLINEDCGYCPNNTECLGEECGCPHENTFDMGSWCLRKEENLFVAEVLGCPCFETFGLIFNMEPVDPNQGGVVISGSVFGMATRENLLTSFQSNGLLVYDLPDGDSIVMFAMPLPKKGYPLRCLVEANKSCWANLHGKFQGPDTIHATIRFKNCRDNDGNYTTFEEEYPVLLTRWE